MPSFVTGILLSVGFTNRVEANTHARDGGPLSCKPQGEQSVWRAEQGDYPLGPRRGQETRRNCANLC